MKKIYKQNFASIAFIMLMMIQCLTTVELFAQQDRSAISNKKYNELKVQGKLIGNERIVHFEADTKNPLLTTSASNRIATAGICNCWIPRDTSWSIVPFDGFGSVGTAPDYRNDDGSTLAKSLPFNFCFYGTNYNTVYINNNGNIYLF